MPQVTFTSSTGITLPSAVVTPEQTTPEGLRKVFFEKTGRDAFVLHDGGLGLGLDRLSLDPLGLNRESFTVRLEDSGAAPNPYAPLETSIRYSSLVL